jgi:hypothetical protein
MGQGVGRSSSRSQDVYSTAPGSIGNARSVAVRAGMRREPCTGGGALTFRGEKVVDAGGRFFMEFPKK